MLANSIHFKIKYPDDFIIYISENFTKSYFNDDHFDSDPNQFYQFRISKTDEIKQKEPYNSVPLNYRQVNCKLKCLRKIRKKQLLFNTFAQKCLTVKATRFDSSSDHFNEKKTLFSIFFADLNYIQTRLNSDILSGQ